MIWLAEMTKQYKKDGVIWVGDGQKKKQGLAGFSVVLLHDSHVEQEPNAADHCGKSTALVS
jgi:hypothetical protein